jgi:hypothetical protein
MSDIVQRLRDGVDAGAVDLADIMDAADEIERLRQCETAAAVTEPMPKDKWAEVSATLTDEERDAEIARLREAIRRLADQDATLSVVGGDVIVEMDATLTDAERDAVWFAIAYAQNAGHPAEEALRGLLARLA